MFKHLVYPFKKEGTKLGSQVDELKAFMCLNGAMAGVQRHSETKNCIQTFLKGAQPTNKF